jgi:hypothetical protein
VTVARAAAVAFCVGAERIRSSESAGRKGSEANAKGREGGPASPSSGGGWLSIWRCLPEIKQRPLHDTTHDLVSSRLRA